MKVVFINHGIYLSKGIHILFPLVIVLGFAFTFSGNTKEEIKSSNKANLTSKIHYLYSPIRDTMYLMGDVYISISLSEQIATVYHRTDSSVNFPISSGSAGIDDGMHTPTGLFTVQSKSPKAISKQFNDAELFSWVGFNGNIGFHGLSGNGYYRHLGKRPSSHGCIRIARHDGTSLYNKVQRGTPVIVYEKEPAIAFKFAESSEYEPGNDILLQRKDKTANIMFNNRIEALYNGEYFTQVESRIFLDGVSVFKNRGFRIGEAKKIPIKQNPIFISSHFSSIRADATNKPINKSFAAVKSTISDSIINN